MVERSSSSSISSTRPSSVATKMTTTTTTESVSSVSGGGGVENGAHHHHHHYPHANGIQNGGGGAGSGGGVASQFDSLPSTYQLAVLSGGVFLFFGIHNYLQEAIMAVPDFNYGVMLGFMEVFGVTICSYLERQYCSSAQNGSEAGSGSAAQQQQPPQRVAPLSAYPLLTVLLLMSSSLSNMSLNYINFPTKVVFRSCKLIPTMIVASCFMQPRKIFTAGEYACAMAICFGLIMFAAADWQLAPSFNPMGLVLLTLSVCADAILPNAQEKLFRTGASRTEVTLYTNVFTLMAMIVTTLLSGDLLGAWAQICKSQQLTIYFTIYTFVAYVAISTHMTVVKRFGGVAAVLVATGRKGMTLVLSFLLFPKPFSWYYPLGALLVLGGLLISSLLKMNKDNKKKKGSNGHRIKHHVSDVTDEEMEKGLLMSDAQYHHQRQ